MPEERHAKLLARLVRARGAAVGAATEMTVAATIQSFAVAVIETMGVVVPDRPIPLEKLLEFPGDSCTRMMPQPQ